MKTIIYNDDIYNYIEENKPYIIDALKDYEISVNYENIKAEAASMIEADADQLKEFLKKYDSDNKNKILVTASLGLWYGKREGKKAFNGLSDIFFNFCEDYNKVYFKTASSTLTLEAAHHDGVNVFKFYKLVNGKKRAIKYNEFINY